MAPAGYGQAVISEFQAANTATLKDEDGEFEDWIEIGITGGGVVDLGGWYLTDEAARLTKWQLPATNLQAGQFLIVFASNKDRTRTGGQLHTNFRLSAGGEYLALVKPDGKTIATAYAPSFPPQAENLSYGLPLTELTNALVAQGASGKMLLPHDGSLGLSWVLPEFNDSGWMDVRTGVGFDSGLGYLSDLISSPIGGLMRGSNACAYLRFPFQVSQPAGLSGLKLRMRYNDGFIAFLNGVPVVVRNAPVATPGGILADSLADWGGAQVQGNNNWYYGFYDRSADADAVYDPVTDFNSTDSQWTWNGGAWVLGPSNPPWDLISSSGWHPNGSTSGALHWVIRRWICETWGTVACQIDFAKENLACGNGATLRVLQNGIERCRWTAAYNDAVGLRTNLVLTGLQAGDFVDFALDPTGADQGTDDSCDGSTFAVVISQTPEEGPSWNSTATGAQTQAQTLAGEEMDLSRYKDLFVLGTNVLAIHALNASVNDADFLVLPELEGTTLGFDTTQQAYFSKPTPGVANGPASTDIGPAVSDIQHAPRIPLDEDDLMVLARVIPTLRTVTAVELRYRVMYGLETMTPMYDDGKHGDGAAGDSIYGARIPANVSGRGQMVRYAVTATDSAALATRAPLFASATLSPQYFGTVVWDPALTNSRLPVLHWFIQNPSAADSDATARCSFFYDGEFYDNVGVNLHGQSTRGFPKKSYDLDFNPGYNLRWSESAPRVGALNLLTTWADKSHMRSVLAHETYRDSGAPAHFAFPVRVQRNGAFFSVANLVENGGADFLERLGLDRNGALYKMYNSAESTALAEKKTRRTEGNGDLQALITGMSQSDATARQTFMYDNLDIPEMVDFLAAKIITADTDCCHKNYYLYRDSDGSGEWQAMPWDVDLSFGRVWTCGSPCLAYYDEAIYTNTSIFVGDGNRVFSPIYATPATRQMFLRRLRTLMDELFQPPGTPATNDFYRLKTLALRDQIAPDAALDLAKWGTWGARETVTQAVNRIWNEFLPGRRGYLFGNMSVSSRGEIPLSQPTNAAVRIDGFEYRPSSGNALEEWLSITNANAYAVDISNWQLEGGVRFKFKPGTVIPARSALYVSPDVRAFRNRLVSPKGKERRVVVGPYSGNLSAWGESLTLSDTAGRLVSSNAFSGNPSAAQRYLRVTEVFYNPDPMSGNSSLEPQQFEFIELRNTGPASLDLSGVRFTAGVQFDFTGSAITNLASGARVLVVRDVNALRLRYGGSLPLAGQFVGSLDNAGERLRLEDGFGEKILDFVYDNQWYPITDGHGYSLAIVDDTVSWALWGEKASWRPNGSLGGTPALADPLLPGFAPIVINEILAHTDPPASDAIELFNPTGTNVAVGNWYLTDEFDAPRKFRIPSGTMIPPHGFIHFTEANFNSRPEASTSFVLNSEGEEVWLFSADSASNLTGYVQGFDFGATANGVSLGRHANSIGDIDYPAQTAATLGRTNAGPLVGPVVISEIMYHPMAVSTSDLAASYIELANITTASIPLFNPSERTNTWRLRNAVDFDFPTNVVVAPGGQLLVVGFDPVTNAAALAAFKTLYGVASQVPIHGPWQGRLGNAGETLELKKPDAWGTNGVPYVMVEKVDYLDQAPWPEIADGAGASLQRRTLSAYANEPTNWFASTPTAGAPNRPNAPPTVTLSSPSDGAVFQAPNEIHLAASAADTDGQVQRVQFRADGRKLAELQAPPYVLVWTNPPPGRHTITAIAADDRLGMAESQPVSITVISPPPTILLTQPANGTVVKAGTELTLSASAESTGGRIDKVAFYSNGLLLTEKFAAPYSVPWSPAQAGTYALTAVAMDSWGSTSTSAVVTVAFVESEDSPVTLVSSRSTWKYLDNGSNPLTAWRQLDFNDAGWKSGPAELGYGDEADGRPEATQIGYGPDAANKYITYYFRLAFTAAQAAELLDLKASLLRDDGAVVYLNGTEVFRSNMATGQVSYLQTAIGAAAGGEETTWFEQAVASSLLREGKNVVAVEVHQSAAGSSDLSFDLGLTATRRVLAPAILAQPLSQSLATGETGVFTVWAGGTGPLAYRWTFNGQPLPGATEPSLIITNASLANAGAYQVTISNAMGSVLSEKATLTLLDGGTIPGLNQIAIAPISGGYLLRYHGVAGRTCQIQRSSDLAEWTTLLSTTVPTHGMVIYADIELPADAAYYRAVQE